VDSVQQPGGDTGSSDDDRIVDLDDDGPVLPDQTRDDTDHGWGGSAWSDRSWSNDDRLREDRPPHWG
jgi:hypothetical protein